MIDAALLETTFVVFHLDGTLIGVAAVDVAAVQSEQPAADMADEGVTRVVRLRSQDGQKPPQIRARGALQVLSLPVAQVVPLPRLCASAQGYTVAVALHEERVRFLIIDPYRLAQVDAPAVADAGAQESR